MYDLWQTQTAWHGIASKRSLSAYSRGNNFLISTSNAQFRIPNSRATVYFSDAETLCSFNKKWRMSCENNLVRKIGHLVTTLVFKTENSQLFLSWIPCEKPAMIESARWCKWIVLTCVFGAKVPFALPISAHEAPTLKSAPCLEPPPQLTPFLKVFESHSFVTVGETKSKCKFDFCFSNWKGLLNFQRFCYSFHCCSPF